MNYDSEMYELASPNASSLIQSLRAFGYDVSTAIADLIDNSISAEAKKISIQFEWNGGNPYIAIFDNGRGMTTTELIEAMRLGSKNPKELRSNNDLGRFGLGLKTASFSQCRQLTVITKTIMTDTAIRSWDLDLVIKQNKWLLHKNGSKVCDILRYEFFQNNEQGTIVLLEKIDRMIPEEYVNDDSYQDEFLINAKRVEKHIATVFSDFMFGKEKINFYINNNEIQSWDPFVSESPLTTELPLEILNMNQKQIKIKTFILPHVNRLSNEEYKNYGGQRGWTDHQGFYIYRNKRLIVSGDWLLKDMQKKEQYKLARIRIDISNDLDEEWGIDVRKSIAIPPLSVQKDIIRIAIAAQRESSKIYKHRGKKLARSTKKDELYIWHQKIKHGKISYNINRDHIYIKSLFASEQGKEIKRLLELIEETIPIPAIISDYSDNPENFQNPLEGKDPETYDELLENLYNFYINDMISPIDALANIANMEPFIYIPDRIEIFKNKKGLK